MKTSHAKTNRLAIWGDGLLNKLRGRSRKKRKREASKKRRVALDPELQHEDHRQSSPGNNTVQIFVALLEEGVDVWRPVSARMLPGEVYEIQGPVPEEEVWEFPPGTRVRCETRSFDDGPGVVAVARADAA